MNEDREIIQPDWDVALSTLDMPSGERASIEAAREASYQRSPEAKDATVGEKTAQAASAEPVVADAETAKDTSDANITSSVDANTASSEETQTNEDIFEFFDPTKEYKMPDGEVLKGSQVLQGIMKKKEYDGEKWKLNKEKEQLQSRLEWLGTAEKTESARKLLQLVDSGIPEDEAVRILAEQMGVKSTGVAQQEAPAPNNSYSIDPTELQKRLPQIPQDMEAGSEEHTAWYWSIYEPMKTVITVEMALEKERERTDARMESLQAKANADAEVKAKEQTQLDQVASYNDTMVSKMGDMMYEWYGVSYDNLTQEHKVDVTNRLNKAIQENGAGWIADEVGKRTNRLTMSDVKTIVRDAFPENANPYKGGVSRPRATNSSEKPLSAEPSSSQIKATPRNGHAPENYATRMEAAMAELSSK